MGFTEAAKQFWNEVGPLWAQFTIAPNAYPFTDVESRIAYLERELMNGHSQGSSRSGNYELSTTHGVRKAFKACSPLPTIVSQKAWAFTRGEVVVWNPKNKKPVRGQFKEWEQLLHNPNTEQSQRQFYHQAYTYQQKYGYCVIRKIYPAGFSNRPAELYVIPNWAFEPIGYNGALTVAYFTYGGKREELDLDELIFIIDPASNDIDESTGLPYSRARELDGEVSNVAAALASRGAMIKDRGIQGVVTNRTKDAVSHLDMKPSDREAMERRWNSGGIMPHQKKIMVTDADVDYIPMTMNSKDLQLQDESVTCLKTICNRYGFAFNALAEGFNGKYNSTSSMLQQMQDATIGPEATDFFEQLSLGLGMYKENCEAYMDYSGVAALQKSQKDQGEGQQAMAQAYETQWDLGIVTRNDILDGMGRERVAGRPEFDKYKWELTPEELGSINQNQQGNGQDQNNNDQSQGATDQTTN